MVETQKKIKTGDLKILLYFEQIKHNLIIC